MAPRIRLIATLAPDGESVRFEAAFAAPRAGDVEICAPALLETGDGRTVEPGMLCSPTPYTWRSQERTFLADHRYVEAGPHKALLRWGDLVVEATVPAAALPRGLEEPAPGPGRPRALEGEGPTVALFAVNAVPDEPNRRRVRLQLAGLAATQLVRLDGDVGQVEWLSAADGPEPSGEWLFDYPKPGRYTVAVDLVDGEGFWLATLAETPIEIVPPADAAYPGLARPTVRAAPPAEEAPQIVAQEVGADRPWLPYRNYRPTWGWTYLYTQPGGSVISRTAWAGTYLSARAETMVGGARWFRTAGGDWVAASNVTLMVPSELRGVELAGTTPPSPPPPLPPPSAVRRGVVTADVLNVRAQPGVRADNPPIARLLSGTQVSIYEEAPYGDAIWYRIGEGRWVHGGWVRLIETTPAPTPEPTPTTRRGVVTADALNVRARPGVRPDNPPVAVLYNGAEVTIYEETPVDGVPWYRIGESRWVHSGWVRIISTTRATRAAAAAESTLSLPIGFVVADALNVRGRPGVSADNPPLYQVPHNQAVPVLEEATVAGARWYRIGADRWVEGSWVGVARFKPRPSSIGPNERWVGVNLSEQTAVAYEGDRPVYAMLVATGLPGTPTVQGIFRTWLRLETGVMAGPGYYLEDVTWTCYFYSGYGLHTAYWHDAFGRPRSHGCVNLSPYDAWWIFRWSAPGGPNSPAVYVYWS
ncbi:MAG: SH3 domain-containing protein [Anaerolineae bacterium]